MADETQQTPTPAKKAASRPTKKAAARKPAGPVTIYHPTLAGITYEIPAADVKGWTDAGWRKTPPANPQA